MCFLLLSRVGLVGGWPVPPQRYPVATSSLALRLRVSSAWHPSCLTAAGGQESGLVSGRRQPTFTP